jgi:hypothetical protein
MQQISDFIEENYGSRLSEETLHHSHPCGILNGISSSMLYTIPVAINFS